MKKLKYAGIASTVLLPIVIIVVIIMVIVSAFTTYGEAADSVGDTSEHMGEITRIDEYLNPINAKIEETGGIVIDTNFVYAAYMVIFSNELKEDDFYERFVSCFYYVYVNDISGEECYTAQQDEDLIYEALGGILGAVILPEKREKVREYADKLGIAQSGSFLSPIENVDVLNFVTSPFGNRKDPFTGATKYHSGIDISYGGIHGVPAVSVAKGTVTFSGYEPGYGNYVIVQHNGSISTLYAHLDSCSVNAGDRLISGHEVGKIGNSGRSTGSHLHFEVQINGKAVNPEPYVRGDTLIE